MEPTPEQFVQAAQAYLGTKWRHQGRTRQGIDCVGLLICAATDAGIIVQDVRDYDRWPDGERLACLLHQYCLLLPKGEPIQAGDILAIKYANAPQHVAIVTKQTEWGPFVVHALGNEEAGGSVVEHMLDHRWLNSHRAKIHAIFRPKAWAGDIKAEEKDCGCGS